MDEGSGWGSFKKSLPVLLNLTPKRPIVPESRATAKLSPQAWDTPDPKIPSDMDVASVNK